MAATPSVLFFGGVVNPTGFETSVAICLWTSALILARERLKDPPLGLVALVAVSGGIEALVRSMSPFWVVLTLLTALAVAEWGELGPFLRSRRAWLAGAFLVICGVLGTAWIVLKHSLNVVPPGAPEPAKVHGIPYLLIDGLLRTPQYFTEMVSRFGWLVAPSPDFTYLVWAGLIGFVVLLAFATGSPRRCVTLVVLLAAVVVIPVVISVGQAHRLGITWQGKDTLPLAVGVPILGASMLANSALASVQIYRSRLVGVAAVAAALATLVALFGDLRRNAVGDAASSLFVSACDLAAAARDHGRLPVRDSRHGAVDGAVHRARDSSRRIADPVAGTAAHSPTNPRLGHSSPSAASAVPLQRETEPSPAAR